MSQSTIIKIPSSTANLGPGFDALGASLSLYLELKFTILPVNLPTVITYLGPGSVPTSINENLITKTALYISAMHNTPFPNLNLLITNNIPLGRGLGSSGCAVVGGVCLANEVCKLNLSIQEILDYCVMIEGHPDNVSASLMGGITASYCRSSIEKMHHSFLEYLKPQSSSSSLVSQKILAPITECVKIPYSPMIKAVVVIPKFELSTDLARSVLPNQYSRQDVVFNLQRISVLCCALSTTPLNGRVISECMHDKIHQEYRKHLVPGLGDILEMKNIDGLLGTCLSGAGPTILALADGNFENIGQQIVDIFRAHQQEAEYLILDFCSSGTTITTFKL